MRRPLFPIVLALALTILLSSSAASPSFLWNKSHLRTPFLWGAAELPSWIKAQAGRPVEAPTRFQRGVDPADEGREVDMRMIFDALKRDLRAAMDKKEEGEESRSDYEIEPELEEIKDKAGPSFHIKQISPYLSPYSLYKYRL